MADEIIKARVWTKVGTLDEWNANEMLLGQGEMALVVSGNGIPMNMKWGEVTPKRFSDLPFAIQYDGGAYVNVSSTSLPSPSIDVGYSIVSAGTYTRVGQPDIVIESGNIGVIYWDGSQWYLQQSWFAGGRGIIDVEKTGSIGLVDTYTINYTDSTTSTFEVKNGEDGTNAQSFNFLGNVTNYAGLPTSGNTQNDAWYNLADELLYVYNGTAYPPNGEGIFMGMQDPTENIDIEDLPTYTDGMTQAFGKDHLNALSWLDY